MSAPVAIRKYRESGFRLRVGVTPLLAAAGAIGCDIRYGGGMLDMQRDLTLDFFSLRG